MATLLPNGKVLIAGGDDGFSGIRIVQTDVYDPATDTFAAAINTRSINVGRESPLATLLLSGKVLITQDYQAFIKTTELYTP
jgi:hypothetical protein